MDYYKLHKSILLSTIQLSGLITIWGVTNFLNTSYYLDELTLIKKHIFGYSIAVDGRILYGLSLATSIGIILNNGFMLAN